MFGALTQARQSLFSNLRLVDCRDMTWPDGFFWFDGCGCGPTIHHEPLGFWVLQSCLRDSLLVAAAIRANIATYWSSNSGRPHCAPGSVGCPREDVLSLRKNGAGGLVGLRGSSMPIAAKTRGKPLAMWCNQGSASALVLGFANLLQSRID